MQNTSSASASLIYFLDELLFCDQFCCRLYKTIHILPTQYFAFWQVRVRDGSTDWGWGVVVNVVKKPPASGTLPPALSASRSNNYIVDTLLHCSSNSSENGSRSKPCPPRPGEKGEMHVVS